MIVKARLVEPDGPPVVRPPFGEIIAEFLVWSAGAIGTLAAGAKSTLAAGAKLSEDDWMSDAQLPLWNDDQALEMMGATIVVGITHATPEGERYEQCFGKVVAVSSKQGIALHLGGSREGETLWLPPDLRAIAPAAAGTYNLRSTGESVSNPDFTATWTIYPKEEEAPTPSGNASAGSRPR